MAVSWRYAGLAPLLSGPSSHGTTFLIPTSSGSGSRGPAFLVGHSEGHQTLKTTAASIPQLRGMGCLGRTSLPTPLHRACWSLLGRRTETGLPLLPWGFRGPSMDCPERCPTERGNGSWNSSYQANTPRPRPNMAVSGPKEELLFQICTKIPSGLRVALGFLSPCNPSCHLLG